MLWRGRGGLDSLEDSSAQGKEDRERRRQKESTLYGRRFSAQGEIVIESETEGASKYCTGSQFGRQHSSG